MKRIIIGFLLLVTLSTLDNGIIYADKRPVKIWPLYYHEEDPEKELKETDVMWPIFLKKKEGTERRFAIRPFYIGRKDPAKDFKKTDILWPFYCSKKRKASKEGRIAPLLWYGKINKRLDYLIFFPLLWCGKEDEKFDYLVFFPLYWQGRVHLVIFPIYWQLRDHWAIFPIFWKGENYCVVVPVYGKGKYFMTIFPPLFWKVKDSIVVFPFWWQGKNYITFFPIYWQGETSQGKRFIVIFPVYWHAKDKFWFVFPVGGRIGKGDKYTDFILWPLYVKSKDKETHTLSFIWPMLSLKWDGGVKGSRILPLYGYYNKRYEVTGVINKRYEVTGTIEKSFAFFSFYWFCKDKYISKNLKHTHEKKKYGFFPLYWCKRSCKYRDDKFSKSRYHVVFPLYWCDYDRDKRLGEDLSSRAVKFFPFFTYHRWKNDKVRFSALWPLWLQEWNDPEIEETYAIFWRLWDYQRDKEGNTRARVVWRLYRREKRGDYKSTELMPFFTSEKKAKEKRHFAIFWRFFEYERVGREKSLRLFYLPKFPSWGVEKAKDQKE